MATKTERHWKVLGQSAPSAASSTTLYTCPSSTETVVSFVAVCNRSNIATSYRLGIDVDAAGDGTTDYLHYDCQIEGNETHYVAQGATLDASDLIRCYATLATLTFTACGQENT